MKVVFSGKVLVHTAETSDGYMCHGLSQPEHNYHSQSICGMTGIAEHCLSPLAKAETLMLEFLWTLRKGSCRICNIIILKYFYRQFTNDILLTLY